METINYLLGYKNLKIVQNTEMFCFSLDSILLPNFVTINTRTKHILDIGCGNAPMPLIISNKTKAHITGVEIQKEIFDLAEKTIKINNKEDQIDIILGNICEIYKKWESDTFDVIVCNPPFFKISEGSHFNINNNKTLARHELTLDLEQIMIICKKLLKNNGVVGIVHRPERLVNIIEVMKKNNIEPKKIQFVYPKIGSDANILLIEGKKNGNSGLKIMSPIYSHDANGDYSKQIEKFFE